MNVFMSEIRYRVLLFIKKAFNLFPDSQTDIFDFQVEKASILPTQ